jgi:phosphatidylethanolamine-binding protein (PEBP) family uncharacterized protein
VPDHPPFAKYAFWPSQLRGGEGPELALLRHGKVREEVHNEPGSGHWRPSAIGCGGAAPPPGPAHRYIFSVHALKVAHLDVDASASGTMVGFMVNSNSLGKASLTATYGKSP